MTVLKKKIVDTKNKTGFLGFFVCIESLKHLHTTLVEGPRLRYIATYRLSQDHIEMLFGAIRRHGGYNNNPNAVQLKGILKKNLQHLEMKSSFLGNCLPLEDIPELTCTSAIEKINSSVVRFDLITEDDEGFSSLERQNQSGKEADDTKKNYENIEALSSMLNRESVRKIADQIIGYIFGWVSRKLVKSLKCDVCTNSLLSDTKLWFHKLIVLKNMGGLCFPSEEVFQICLKSEAIIKIILK